MSKDALAVASRGYRHGHRPQRALMALIHAPNATPPTLVHARPYTVRVSIEAAQSRAAQPTLRSPMLNCSQPRLTRSKFDSS